MPVHHFEVGQAGVAITALRRMSVRLCEKIVRRDVLRHDDRFRNGIGRQRNVVWNIVQRIPKFAADYESRQSEGIGKTFRLGK